MYSERVFYKWLVPALLEWVAIAALFALGFWAHNFFVWVIVTFVLGSRQHAIGVLGHDGAHFTAARSKRVNDVATELLCFWPNCTSVLDFRRFHFNHHRNFNTEKDPELLFKHVWSAEQWTLPMTRIRIFSYFAGDLIGLGVWEAVKAHRLLGMSSARSWYGPALWWSVAGAVLIATGYGFAIVIWFIALLTSFWAFFRLRTWIEHVGTDSTHRIRANWWQRIFITPHCSWSHYEHHIYPSVPFWRRHELRGPEDATIGMGELFDSFRQGRHKLPSAL